MAAPREAVVAAPREAVVAALQPAAPAVRPWWLTPPWIRSSRLRTCLEPTPTPPILSRATPWMFLRVWRALEWHAAVAVDTSRAMEAAQSRRPRAMAPHAVPAGEPSPATALAASPRPRTSGRAVLTAVSVSSGECPWTVRSAARASVRIPLLGAALRAGANDYRSSDRSRSSVARGCSSRSRPRAMRNAGPLLARRTTVVRSRVRWSG